MSSLFFNDIHTFTYRKETELHRGLFYLDILVGGVKYKEIARIDTNTPLMLFGELTGDQSLI